MKRSRTALQDQAIRWRTGIADLDDIVNGFTTREFIAAMQKFESYAAMMRLALVNAGIEPPTSRPGEPGGDVLAVKKLLNRTPPQGYSVKAINNFVDHLVSDLPHKKIRFMASEFARLSRYLRQRASAAIPTLN